MTPETLMLGLKQSQKLTLVTLKPFWPQVLEQLSIPVQRWIQTSADTRWALIEVVTEM